jgi:hypothetical protein
MKVIAYLVPVVNTVIVLVLPSQLGFVVKDGTALVVAGVLCPIQPLKVVDTVLLGSFVLKDLIIQYLAQVVITVASPTCQSPLIDVMQDTTVD